MRNRTPSIVQRKRNIPQPVPRLDQRGVIRRADGDRLHLAHIDNERPASAAEAISDI